MALRCSWIQRLYNENFQEWKLIPLTYIHKTFGKNFKFHSKLHIPFNLICTFPNFCQDMITSWCQYSSATTFSSTISTQYLWFNTFIKIESPSDKKQPNLLHLGAQRKWTLLYFHIAENYCAYLAKIFRKFFSEPIFYVKRCLYPLHCNNQYYNTFSNIKC